MTSTTKILSPGIEQAEGRCGGDPVIEGTRLTTRMVAINAARYSTKQMIEFWPDLTAETITAAVEWEAEHPTPPHDWYDMTDTERGTVMALLHQTLYDMGEDPRGPLLHALITAIEDGTLS